MDLPFVSQCVKFRENLLRKFHSGLRSPDQSANSSLWVFESAADGGDEAGRDSRHELTAHDGSKNAINGTAGTESCRSLNFWIGGGSVLAVFDLGFVAAEEHSHILNRGQGNDKNAAHYAEGERRLQQPGCHHEHHANTSSCAA